MPDTLPHNAKIFAIDPGVNGGYAVLGTAGEFINANELPRFGRSLNAVELGSLIRSYQPEVVIIEQVGPMPKQGLGSTFVFGMAYGICLGVAGGAGVPVVLVTPQRWKGHCRLIGKPKDMARELAIRLYPEAADLLKLKRHGGRADAMLIARYGHDMDTGARLL